MPLVEKVALTSSNPLNFSLEGLIFTLLPSSTGGYSQKDSVTKEGDGDGESGGVSVEVGDGGDGVGWVDEETVGEASVLNLGCVELSERS